MLNPRREALTGCIYSTGSAGLIQMIRRWSDKGWASAAVATVATVGWIIQGGGLGFYYMKVRRSLHWTIDLAVESCT